MWRGLLRLAFGFVALARLGCGYYLGGCNVANSSTTRRCTRPPTASAFARASLQPTLPAAGELGRCAARVCLSRGRSTLAADIWPREIKVGGVGVVGRCGVAACGGSTRVGAFVVPACWRWLMRSSGGERNNTATQQGAAPDRLQLRSFLAPLPAAGELSRCAACARLGCNRNLRT